MAEDSTVKLEAWDIGIITAYFVLVLIVGLIATVRANRSNATGFFLAGKSMTFIPIAGSLWASNMGASLFIGMTGSAAGEGIAPVLYEWHATYTLIILGWIFVPIYIATATHTMPDYLSKRFGRKRLRIYFASLFLLVQTISGIPSELYAGSLFMKEFLGWNVYASILLILVFTAVFTIAGGLTAVIYTDTMQSVILIVGATAVSIVAIEKVGGYDSLFNQFMEAASRETYLLQSFGGNGSCGFPPSDSFHLLRGMDSSYPWPGMTFGLTIIATYYFCTNQVIVQRTLAGKSLSHSKAACVISSYLKILPYFLFILPGMASRILYPDEVGCSSPETCESHCGDKAGCTNMAYPLLVVNILPPGVRGLMMAAMLAALMSTLTSMFNSCSSIFTLDIWMYFRPKASDFEVVLVGRACGLFLIGLSIAWQPALQILQGGKLLDYIQAISSFISPTLIVAFVLGIFWSRLTEKGVWWGLMAGIVTGAVRMIIEFSYTAPHCGSGDPDERPDVLTKIHFQVFACILAAVTFVVMVAVSIVTQPRKPEQLRRVTWYTRHDVDWPELTDDSSDEDDGKVAPHQNETETKELTCARKSYNILCEGSSKVSAKLSKAERNLQRLALTSIEEDSFWVRVCDYNAIIALALTCLIIGFYA